MEILVQNFANDVENLYNLITEITDKISDKSDNVVENIRSVFIKNNILKAN